VVESAEAWAFVPNPDDPCPECRDQLGRHVFYPTDRTPSETLPTACGALLCPEDECHCALRWGTATEPDAFWPGNDELEATRVRLRRVPPSEHPSGRRSLAVLRIWRDDPDPAMQAARERIIREQQKQGPDASG
jgi:hypothetical protein